jgi:PII-like signaling protein
MKTEEAVLLRIFVGEDKRHGERPLYEAIALRAREMHLMGATVLHGRLGFGRSTRLHTIRALMSEDLPLVIEIVDKAERIEAFMPVLAGMPGIGLITREPVEMVRAMPAP